MKVTLIILLVSPLIAIGQREWTLQECIDSAVVNNPGVRISDINLSISEVNHNANKLNFLPTVGANATHGYNWGQTIDQFTNQFATNRVQYNNFYLSSSVVLFSGLSNRYSTQISGTDKKITALNNQLEKRALSLEIIGAYLQSMLNEEIVALKEKHLSYTIAQLEKVTLLEELQYETKRKRLESEAQKTKDAYQFVLATNDLKKSLLLLQTLIGKSYDSTFFLAENPEISARFNVNELELNSLLAEKKVLESKLTIGALSPSLSLNGSLGSGYSENNKFVNSQGQFVSKPFGDQLGENFYQSLSIGLRIPIFSGTNSYSQLKIKQLEHEQVILEGEQRLREREGKLLEYRLTIENQKEALKATIASYEAFDRLFNDAQLEFDSGTMDYYSYLQAKDSFQNAESELIQAKYQLLFAELIFEMYF